MAPARAFDYIPSPLPGQYRNAAGVVLVQQWHLVGMSPFKLPFQALATNRAGLVSIRKMPHTHTFCVLLLRVLFVFMTSLGAAGVFYSCARTV